MIAQGEEIVSGAEPPQPAVEQRGIPHNHPVEIPLEYRAPEDLIGIFSEEYGADPVLAKAIVMCESGIYGNDEIQEYQRTIPTQVPNVVSSASGYFQFLDSTWRNTIRRMGLPPETDKHDPVESIRAGVWLLATDGTVHWLESRKCWIKHT